MHCCLSTTWCEHAARRPPGVSRRIQVQAAASLRVAGGLDCMHTTVHTMNKKSSSWQHTACMQQPLLPPHIHVCLCHDTPPPPARRDLSPLAGGSGAPTPTKGSHWCQTALAPRWCWGWVSPLAACGGPSQRQSPEIVLDRGSSSSSRGGGDTQGRQSEQGQGCAKPRKSMAHAKVLPVGCAACAPYCRPVVLGCLLSTSRRSTHDCSNGRVFQYLGLIYFSSFNLHTSLQHN